MFSPRLYMVLQYKYINQVYNKDCIPIFILGRGFDVVVNATACHVVSTLG